MVQNISEAEALVREKDNLVRDERKLDTWMVHMRLYGALVSERDMPKPRRRLFLRKSGDGAYTYEELDPVVTDEFYKFVGDKRLAMQFRIREIEESLANPKGTR